MLVAQQLASQLSIAVYQGKVDEVLAELKAHRKGTAQSGCSREVNKETLTAALIKRTEEKISARAESSLLRLLNSYGKEINTKEGAQAFVDWLSKGQRGKSTVNRYLEVLKPVAPELFADVQKLKGVERRHEKPFTKEEVKRILTTLKNDPYYSYYYPYVVFLFRTGVRTSEAIGLRWTDVDLSNGAVYIGSSLARKGETTKRVRKGTKNGKVRVVPLHELTVKLLASLPRTHSLVFPSPKGIPIDDHNFRNRCWKKTLEKAGVEYRRPYNTRHTFISHALESGSNPVAIAAMAGHRVNTMFAKYSGLVKSVDAPKLEYWRLFRFLCKRISVQKVKRSGNRIAKCESAAFQFFTGLVQRFEILRIAKYINFKTDSSLGNTALVLITLRSERLRDSMALVV